MLDVSIKERDDDRLAVNTDVFSCAVCEGDHAGAITVHFLYLKPDQNPNSHHGFHTISLILCGRIDNIRILTVGMELL